MNRKSCGYDKSFEHIQPHLEFGVFYGIDNIAEHKHLSK